METGRLPKEYVALAGRSLLGRGAWLSAILVGVLGGLAATVVGPLFLIVGLISAAVLLAILAKGYRLFWAYLLFILFGYLLLGKGFAYIGVAPIYVAEIGLGLAVGSALTMLLTNRLKTVAPFFRLEVVFLLLFVAWQTWCTIPYVNTYGQDALRDAALWGYAAFALLILLLIPRESVDKLSLIYGRVLPYALAWLLAAWGLTRVFSFGIFFPGSPVPLIYLKPGDVGVHLAGAAAFMLLRLDRRGVEWSDRKLWLLWGLWVADWAVWGVSNRAGMLSALIGIAVVLLLRPNTKWYRPVVVAGSLLTLLLVTNFSSPAFVNQYDPYQKEGSISAQQIVENVTSTFGGGSSYTLNSTRDWRLRWWQKISGYTFGGEYFWTGKGYGINLANDDGFQTDLEYESLRNPHNVFMTILARSGVPGLALWALFLTSFGSTLVRKSLVKGGTDPWTTRYALWFLAYWLAFLFNGSLDVFLEGPMGGVWFWSLVGISLVYFTRDAGNSDTQELNKAHTGIAPLPRPARL
jgi:hypothetical protein